jgi:hypothetical protein
MYAADVETVSSVSTDGRTGSFPQTILHTELEQERQTADKQCMDTLNTSLGPSRNWADWREHWDTALA